MTLFERRAAGQSPTRGSDAPVSGSNRSGDFQPTCRVCGSPLPIAKASHECPYGVWVGE